MSTIQWLEERDKEILLWINSHHNTFWDKIMWFASGDKSWIPVYVILFSILIWKFGKQSWWLILLILPLITISDQLAASVIRPWAMRPRPSHEPVLQNLLHFVNGYTGGNYGFVSAHTLNVFSLATYLSRTTSKRIKWLPYFLFPWATLVAYSRIYLGVHYPSDVLVPLLLGVVLGLAFGFIYFHFKTKLFTDKS